jgi:signal transduction histidine kinase
MARVAARVDAGDLTPRMPAERTSADEIRQLAESFDTMLDRLGDAFARQRAFAADASHELRTPLTVIRGQLEVLARNPDPHADDVRRVERLVRTEIVRMERLVEDLLVLARSDQREFLRRRTVDLEPFCRELVDGFAATADRRFELGAVPAGTVEADPDRLAQALRNLIRNAIDHTGPGGLVRLVVSTAQGGGVVLAVEDDGPGIPPDQRERVFDRFHRTDSARNRVRGGAGLGLAIVRAIVEAHGGRVAAGQSPEGGARVEIELPGFNPGSGAPVYAPAVSSSS